MYSERSVSSIYPTSTDMDTVLTDIDSSELFQLGQQNMGNNDSCCCLVSKSCLTILQPHGL